MSSVLEYNPRKLNKYKSDLQLIASLSGLFSESETPLIYYRATENIYCECFGAANVSRADCTADAVLGNCGVGIKTFVSDNHIQKIAEFNRQRIFYNRLTGLDLAKAISRLRNERIELTKRLYRLDKLIYHCVVRSPGQIDVFEEIMNSIDIDHIVIIQEDDRKMVFDDGLEKYEFNFSKSTLYKIFNLIDPMFSVPVQIIENPMDSLRAMAESYRLQGFNRERHYMCSGETERLIIPLYSTKKGEKFVGEKSGLNQWNAGGRARDPNEVYIPYPASIRKECPTFFPNRESKWEMKLPNGEILSMKICQQGGKAIMSDPNKDLGKWLLREVLQLRPGEVLTYNKLLEIGIDSVIFTKRFDIYSIDFVTYED